MVIVVVLPVILALNAPKSVRKDTMVIIAWNLATVRVTSSHAILLMVVRANTDTEVRIATKNYFRVTFNIKKLVTEV